MALMKEAASRATIREIPGYAFGAEGRPSIGSAPEELYGYAHLIRSTEELILDLFSRGLLSGTTHTCLGQELCQMSVVRALDHADDMVLSNHRNHGHFLTYSGDFLGLVAEVMGREAGVCGGYGGSQHIAFKNFHSNGVQAGMTAIGSGIGLERRLRGSRGVVAVMVGDGTLGEGLLYESMNLAAVWGARTLFVVENNGIAQTTYTRETVAGGIEARGAAFGLRVWRLDDAAPDFIGAVEAIVAEMRERAAPGMLVIDTHRLGPHSKGDDLRDAEEKRKGADRDPLARLGRAIGEAARARIEERNRLFIKQTEEIALASPEAKFFAAPERIFRPARAASLPAPAGESVTVRQSLNGALRSLLQHSPDVVVLGEDLHEPYGGAFKVTAGLSEEFRGRVISTPISEAGITGAGIGLAMSGKRPIVEIMFADFMTLCMDQIYNHAVKFPGMFADCDVPLVVRTPCGGRRGYGPTHSQSPENVFVSVPGLTVVYGSHRHDVGKLLVDAVARWPNPVLFLEHKLLYGEEQATKGFQLVAPDSRDHGADVFPTVRSGPQQADVTLVCFGGMVPVAERAAARLESEEELAVEILCPSLLAPLPRHTLLRSLLMRPRIVVVEESHHEFGFSAELLATLAEAKYRGTVIRLGMPPVPIASARSLERMQLVDEAMIFDRVVDLF